MTDEELAHLMITAMCIRTVQYALITLGVCQQLAPDIFATEVGSDRA